MSTQKVSFARSGIIAAIIVAATILLIFLSTLLIHNYWGKLTLIILTIGATLFSIRHSFATWRTTGAAAAPHRPSGLV